MYSIQPATFEHMEYIATRLRREHNREAALAGLDGVDALRLSFIHAAACYSFLADGDPLFLAGAMEPEAIDNSAVAWMAGTPEIDAHPFAVLEAARVILPHLHFESGAKRLENYVPADYRKAIKFACWLGCKRGAFVVRGNVPHEHIYHDVGGDEL